MSSEETWQAKVCMDSIQGKIQRVRALHNHNGANRSPVTEAQDALAEESPVKLMPELMVIEQGIDEDNSHNQHEVMKKKSSEYLQITPKNVPVETNQNKDEPSQLNKLMNKQEIG